MFCVEPFYSQSETQTCIVDCNFLVPAFQYQRMKNHFLKIYDHVHIFCLSAFKKVCKMQTTK